MVHALRRDPRDVGLANEPVSELSPEHRRSLGANELAHERFDFAG